MNAHLLDLGREGKNGLGLSFGSIISKLRRETATNHSEVLLSGARSYSEHPQISTLKLYSQCRQWKARQVWAAELLRELRIFLQNSRTLLRLKTVPMIDLGPESGKHRNSGDWIECTQTLGRTRDIAEFHAAHRDASLSQTILFLEGWNKGAEWASCNQDSCREHSDHSSKTSIRWKGYF
jgi:hypothetical protein